MRMIVGVDSRARSHGALEFAAWLREQVVVGERPELGALHVVDEQARVSLRDDLADDLVADAERGLRAALREAAAADAFASVHVLFARSPAEGLVNAVRVRDTDALVIGRIAPREGVMLQRLGRVARALVRSLPRPVVVVPCDLARTNVGDGPIVLASDLQADSREAGRFARALADSIGRPLVVLYVNADYEFVPETSYGQGLALPSTPLVQAADVASWADHEGLRPDAVRVADGDVVDRVTTIAAQLRAPIIVTGSRRLSLAERFFSASVGTELARSADRAVAIVPGA